MATVITINDTLVNDQSSGVQGKLTTDTANDDAIGSDLSGLSSALVTFLGNTSLTSHNVNILSTTQLAFADNVEAAISDPGYVTVKADAGTTLSDLFFSDKDGKDLDGDQVLFEGKALQTVDGKDIYLWSFNDVVLATTSATASAKGDVVAAFYLNETKDHSSASIEMVTFIPIAHPDGTDPDDQIDWSTILNVSASTSINFSFAGAPSGSNLFMTFGDPNATAQIVVIGQNPLNQSEGGNITTKDVLNISQAGGTTSFGVNGNQINPGEGAFVTYVTGTDKGLTVPSLDQNEADVEGNIKFTDAFDTTGASFTINQTNPGVGPVTIKITAFDDLKDPGTQESGINFVDGLTDDKQIAITSVTVLDNVVPSGKDGKQTFPAVINNGDGTWTITGLSTGDKITWTTTDTHNRILIQNISDKDGISGNDNNTFDIGGFGLTKGGTATESVGDTLFVDDDGPSAALATTTAKVTLDETDNDADDNNVGKPLADVTTAISTLFSDTSKFGTDGGKDSNNDHTVDADAKTYSLELNGANGLDSGLVDTLSANKIFLFKEGADIVGRVGNQNGTANAAGDVAFTIKVTNDPDNVQVIQDRAVVHNDPLDPDESTGPESMTADLVLLKINVVDDDGDSSSATAELGSRIKFEDDGPSIDRNATDVPTLITDDTDIPDKAGPTSFAGLFTTPDFGSDGFKDANDDDVQDTDALTYALGVKSPGVDSGLVDTLTNNKIFLFLQSGVVNGRVGNNDGTANSGGTVAFSISVSAAGAVTLDQARAVVHNDPNDPSETGASAAGLANADLVTLTATITDGDLDKDTAVANIGDAFKFEDDGPNAALATNTAKVTLDETDNDADDNNVGAPLANVTTAISTLFSDTSKFGTDGGKDSNNDGTVDADAKTYSLELKGGTGLDSGLVDTLSGDKIFLYTNGADIVGRVGNDDGTANSGGTIAFTIKVTNDPDNVQVIQDRAVVHNDPLDPDESTGPESMTTDLVLLKVNVVDDDGDSSSATAELGSRIKFEDDGPSIDRNATAVPTLTTDDTDITDTAGPTSFAGLFTTPNFGSDGFKDADDDDVQDTDALTYALGVKSAGIDSGLVDTLSGDTIFLFLQNGEVNGRVGNDDGTINNAGDIAFKISVSATGSVTLEQLRAVVHNDPADPAEIGASAAGLKAADLVTLTATVTDGDLDKDTAVADIGNAFKFEDDGPLIDPSGATVPTLTTDDTDIADEAGPTSFAGLFTTPDFGSDGFKDADDDDVQDTDALTYTLGVKATGGVDSGLLDTLTNNKIFLYLDGTVVNGRVGNNDGTANSSGAIAFSISVSATGSVTLDQARAIVHNDPDDPSETGTSAAVLKTADLVTLTATITDGDLDKDTAIVNIGAAFKFEDDGPSITVNDSKGDFKLGAQGSWDHDAGSDGSKSPTLSSLTMTLDSYKIGAGSTVTVDKALTGAIDNDGNFVFTGSIKDDFNGDKIADTVNFTLTLDPDNPETYDLQLTTPPGGTKTFDTSQGQLKSGGPDAVQTLDFPAPTGDVVFFATLPSAKFENGSGSDPNDIEDLVKTDPTTKTDLTEAQLEALKVPTLINTSAQLNVSTAGIGVNNNNLDGFEGKGETNLISGTSISTNDETFVVNPADDVDTVRVFIDNSVGGYTPATEDLYYVAYFTDGTVSNLTKVVAGDLHAALKTDPTVPKVAVGGSYFDVDGGTKDIEAVQLIMGKGTVKIPVIQFIVETEFNPSAIDLNFTADLFDGDGDHQEDSFSVHLDPAV